MCLGLGYHKDLQTRATFMEVLTKILQQGTEFDTLAETVLADRFERLVELVTMMGDQGELPIAMALANVVPCSQWVCSLLTTHCPFCVTHHLDPGVRYGSVNGITFNANGFLLFIGVNMNVSVVLVMCRLWVSECELCH